MVELGAWDELTDEDRLVIIGQLGREPRGVLAVATRCPYGYPQVIANRPVTVEIEDLKVFPTLFWLTCPFLKKQVARLESEGLVRAFQQRLAENPDFANAMGEAHASHCFIRRELVPDAVRDTLAKTYPKRYQVLSESGVGGIRNFSGVKCLHAHLADYLARHNNPIGKEVLAFLGDKEGCSSADCHKEL